MLAIIIINYNKYEKTIDCIETIRNSTFKDYKIYLLDNASQNDSYTILREKYKNEKDIVLIKSEKNLGYANGNNLCIDYAIKDNCKYALISNNDILYDKNTITTLHVEIKRDEYFIVAPKVTLPDGKTQISIKEKAPSFFSYILHETYLSNIFKEKINNFIENKQVYWAAGCCFMVNLEMFRKIGYFDKNTFLYYEEYIISEKAKKNNYKILFYPNVKVIHFHGASTGDININVKLAHLESELYFWKKYRKLSNLNLFILYLIRNIEIKISLNKRKRNDEYIEFRNKSKEIFIREKNKKYKEEL